MNGVYCWECCAAVVVGDTAVAVGVVHILLVGAAHVGSRRSSKSAESTVQKF